MTGRVASRIRNSGKGGQWQITKLGGTLSLDNEFVMLTETSAFVGDGVSNCKLLVSTTGAVTFVTEMD